MSFWYMLMKGSKTEMDIQRKDFIRTRKGTKWEIDPSRLEVRSFNWQGKKWFGLYKYGRK